MTRTATLHHLRQYLQPYVSCLPCRLPACGPDRIAESSMVLDSAVHAYAKSLIHSVLSNFLIIAIVFWVGSRYGGNRKFKNVFPVLSYCLIPVTLGGVVTLAGTHLFVDLVFSYDDMLGTDSPSFALDFAGGSTIPLIHSSFAVTFFGMGFRAIRKGNKDIAWVQNRQSSWCFSTGGSYHIRTYNSTRNLKGTSPASRMALICMGGWCCPALFKYGDLVCADWMGFGQRSTILNSSILQTSSLSYSRFCGISENSHKAHF